MAQKLNLDFSIAESILKGVDSTPDVKIGSVNINKTDVPLVGAASSVINICNDTLDLATNGVESVKTNYGDAIKSFKALQVGSDFGIISAGTKK